jgi:hypothetical protein
VAKNKINYKLRMAFAEAGTGFPAAASVNEGGAMPPF